MQDTVLFQGVTYHLPTGYKDEEIRAALAEQAPAILHADLNKIDNGDGTFTWEYSEKAGTKG